MAVHFLYRSHCNAPGEPFVWRFPFDTVLDCGLFHIFNDDDRAAFVDSLRAALRPGGRYFMLWAKDEKGSWNRVGALKYEEGDRKAKLEGATVPHVSFDLQVTIEKDASAEAPGGNTLLQQHIN